MLGLDLQSVYMNKWWMMLKVISNYLICVQCSAGFAVFTYKDTRCEDKYRIQHQFSVNKLNMKTICTTLWLVFIFNLPH